MNLPPAQVTRAVIQRYARLHHRYSAEWGERPMVLPTGDFFPDEFLGDPDSVALLAARMQEHAGLEDVPLETRVVAPNEPVSETKSCSSGACGVPQTSGTGVARLLDTGDTWVLQVPAQEMRHPVALTTNLARSLAYVFLVETKKENELLEPPVDVTADLVAVGLGFGPLMLQGSYIYAKSCGGPQIASVTKVSVSELAIATILFAELQGHKIKSAFKVLETTQTAALNQAERLLKANKKILARLRSQPERLAREDFSLEEPGDFFGNLKRKFSSKPTPAADPLESVDASMDIEDVESLLIDMPPSSQAGRPRPQTGSHGKDDELSSLVADALNETRAQA